MVHLLKSLFELYRPAWMLSPHNHAIILF